MDRTKYKIELSSGNFFYHQKRTMHLYYPQAIPGAGLRGPILIEKNLDGEIKIKKFLFRIGGRGEVKEGGYI